MIMWNTRLPRKFTDQVTMYELAKVLAEAEQARALAKPVALATVRLLRSLPSPDLSE